MIHKCLDFFKYTIYWVYFWYSAERNSNHVAYVFVKSDICKVNYLNNQHSEALSAVFGCQILWNNV